MRSLILIVAPQTSKNEAIRALIPIVALYARPELLYRHVRTSLQDVDLGFAGRRGERHAIHRAIAALSPGDLLETRIVDGGRWELTDRTGTTVGRLARSFEPPVGMRCRAASVLAVVGWSHEASEPEFRDAIKCDAWEVVVTELVFEPHRREDRAGRIDLDVPHEGSESSQV